MGFNRKNHIFTPGSAAPAKRTPEFWAHIPGQVLSWSMCLCSSLSGGGDGMCWGGTWLLCVSSGEAAYSWTLPWQGRRFGDLPWSPWWGSVRKIGKRSTFCISENEFQLKGRFCFWVQALHTALCCSWCLEVCVAISKSEFEVVCAHWHLCVCSGSNF